MIASQSRCQSPFSRHAQRRIRPPPRSFGLFAAEGFDQDRQARRTGQGGPSAGAGADRYRQHVRGAGILRQDGGLRHPADRRLRARDRFRRPGSHCAQRAVGGAVANRAAGGARARLSQPDAAELAGVPGNADSSIAAYQARMARRLLGRSDRADRRSRWPGLAGAACRSGRARRIALRFAGQTVRRSSVCGTAAPRHRQGAPRRNRP